MANFTMHLTGAALGSGVISTLFLAAGLATPQDTILLWALGTAGGLLPDVDLDHSGPAKLMFTGLGLFFAFLLMFNRAAHYSLLEMWLLWGFVYGVVRYLGWRVFSDLTVHRGVFHTLIAAAFFGFATAAIAYRALDLEAQLSWWCGLFVIIGYLIHLILDEVYSVDFINKRLKRSAGTAFKWVDTKDWTGTMLMAAAALLALFMGPSPAVLSDALLTSEPYWLLGQRLWPEGMWFVF